MFKKLLKVGYQIGPKVTRITTSYRQKYVNLTCWGGSDTPQKQINRRNLNTCQFVHKNHRLLWPTVSAWVSFLVNYWLWPMFLSILWFFSQLFLILRYFSFNHLFYSFFFFFPQLFSYLLFKPFLPMCLTLLFSPCFGQNIERERERERESKWT